MILNSYLSHLIVSGIKMASACACVLTVQGAKKGVILYCCYLRVRDRDARHCKAILIKFIVSQTLAHVIFCPHWIIFLPLIRSRDLFRWPAMCAHVQASTSAA